MSTLCTAFPSFPSEGDTPLNTLKNCAKTTAKINMQKTIPIDELRPSWKSHLEFYAFSSRPPTSWLVWVREAFIFSDPMHISTIRPVLYPLKVKSLVGVSHPLYVLVPPAREISAVFVAIVVVLVPADLSESDLVVHVGPPPAAAQNCSSLPLAVMPATFVAAGPSARNRTD
jgi:hypothetical protein